MRKYILILIGLAVVVVGATVLYTNFFLQGPGPLIGSGTIVETTEICDPEEETKMPETFY